MEELETNVVDTEIVETTEVAEESTEQAVEATAE